MALCCDSDSDFEKKVTARIQPEEPKSLEQLPVPVENSHKLRTVRPRAVMLEGLSELLWNDYWLATTDEKMKEQLMIKRRELQVKVGRYFIRKEGDIRNLSLRRRVTLRLDMPSATSMSQINKHIERSKIYYRDIWLPKLDLALVSTPKVESLKKKKVTFGSVQVKTFLYTDLPKTINSSSGTIGSEAISDASRPEIGVSKDGT